MSFYGFYPIKNIDRYVENKSKDSYSNDTKSAIKFMTFYEKYPAIPYGSFVYRAQKYPGDLDLLEDIKSNDSIDQIIDEFINKLIKFLDKLQRTPLHYFSELKAGNDERYEISLGSQVKGVFKPSPNLKNIAKDFFERHLFNKEEYDLINITVDSNLSPGNKWDVLEKIFRDKIILRWNISEIYKGFKILADGTKITLKEAIQSQDSAVKLDIIANIDNKFIEITNYFILTKINRDGSFRPINISIEIAHNPENLKEDIAKLYYSDMYYNLFKAIKRIFSLGRATDSTEYTEKILPLLSSNISEMYQIKSQIESILRIHDLNTSIPTNQIIDQLSVIKDRLSRIIEIDEHFDELINYHIDHYMNNIDPESLKKVVIILKNMINFYTLEFLEYNNMNPFPANVLPEEGLSYDVNIIRRLGEVPKNPYNIVVDIYLANGKLSGGFLEHVHKVFKTDLERDMLQSVIKKYNNYFVPGYEVKYESKQLNVKEPEIFEEEIVEKPQPMNPVDIKEMEEEVVKQPLVDNIKERKVKQKIRELQKYMKKHKPKKHKYTKAELKEIYEATRPKDLLGFPIEEGPSGPNFENLLKLLPGLKRKDVRKSFSDIFTSKPEEEEAEYLITESLSAESPSASEREYQERLQEVEGDDEGELIIGPNVSHPQPVPSQEIEEIDYEPENTELIVYEPSKKENKGPLSRIVDYFKPKKERSEEGIYDISNMQFEQIPGRESFERSNLSPEFYEPQYSEAQKDLLRRRQLRKIDESIYKGLPEKIKPSRRTRLTKEEKEEYLNELGELQNIIYQEQEQNPEYEQEYEQEQEPEYEQNPEYEQEYEYDIPNYSEMRKQYSYTPMTEQEIYENALQNEIDANNKNSEMISKNIREMRREEEKRIREQSKINEQYSFLQQNPYEEEGDEEILSRINKIYNPKNYYELEQEEVEEKKVNPFREPIKFPPSRRNRPMVATEEQIEEFADLEKQYENLKKVNEKNPKIKGKYPGFPKTKGKYPYQEYDFSNLEKQYENLLEEEISQPKMKGQKHISKMYPQEYQYYLENPENEILRNAVSEFEQAYEEEKGLQKDARYIEQLYNEPARKEEARLKLLHQLTPAKIHRAEGPFIEYEEDYEEPVFYKDSGRLIKGHNPVVYTDEEGNTRIITHKSKERAQKEFEEDLDIVPSKPIQVIRPKSKAQIQSESESESESEKEYIRPKSNNDVIIRENNNENNNQIMRKVLKDDVEDEIRYTGPVKGYENYDEAIDRVNNNIGNNINDIIKKYGNNTKIMDKVNKYIEIKNTYDKEIKKTIERLENKYNKYIGHPKLTDRINNNYKDYEDSVQKLYGKLEKSIKKDIVKEEEKNVKEEDPIESYYNILQNRIKMIKQIYGKSPSGFAKLNQAYEEYERAKKRDEEKKGEGLTSEDRIINLQKRFNKRR